MSDQDWVPIVFSNEQRKPKQTFQKSEKKSEPPKKLGLTISQARNSKSLTQPQLANSMGISVSFINKWENEKETPSNSQISQLERKLNVKLPRCKNVKVVE